MEKSLTIYDSNNNQIELAIDEIRKFIAPTADDKEFWMFINTARILNLNPIKREIYFIKYQEKSNIITGYQVYLERAIRSGLLEYWGVDVEKKDPAKRETWIGVFKAKRTDWVKEFEWRVPMVEVDKKQATWNLMPEFLLKKNTLSQGLRMLIPEILSGMPYTIEEVTSGTSETIMEPLPNVPTIEVPVDEQKKMELEKKVAIEKIQKTINSKKTTDELDKWKQAQNGKLETSIIKAEVQEIYDARMLELRVAEVLKVTELLETDVKMYLEMWGIRDQAMYDAAMAGDKAAITELKTDIVTYLAKYKERQEEVAEETELFNELNESE